MVVDIVSLLILLQTSASSSTVTDDLTATDRENIEMFSALVDKIQAVNGDVSGNRELQALYEQIAKLQAKVTANLEEAARRQRKLKLWRCYS
jgi:growth factor-regulated tyrosine kinase substrate